MFVKKILLLASVLFASVAFAAGNDTPSHPVIQWDKAIEMHKAGAVFLDVRNPNEWAEGYVAGATLIALPELEKRYTELPKKEKLLVYCRSGRRSAAASDFLISKGFDAYSVDGGFLAAPPSAVLPRAK